MTGRQVHELKSLEKTSDGWRAEIAFQVYDKRDKLLYENEGELQCEDGIIKMDMERFIPKESLEALKEMDMTIEIDNLEWPSELSVGKELDYGAVKISGGFLNMSIDITDRKVEEKKRITTPAGTFNTFKISYKINTEMMKRMEMKGVDYIAEEVGVVRSENYNATGKLVDYTALTNYEKSAQR